MSNDEKLSQSSEKLNEDVYLITEDILFTIFKGIFLTEFCCFYVVVQLAPLKWLTDSWIIRLSGSFFLEPKYKSIFNVNVRHFSESLDQFFRLSGSLMHGNSQ